MKLVWHPTTKRDAYGICLDRGGTLYPLAVIEFASVLGSADLERLFRTAPDLLKMLKECRLAIASLDEWALGENVEVEANMDAISWPLRDELLNNIDKIIAKAKGESDA